MSTLQVTIEPVKEIKVHPNADSLELLIIKGWQTIAQKGQFQVGEPVIFIPPDAILPATLHEFLGITKYCSSLPKGYCITGDPIDLEDITLATAIIEEDHENQCLYGNPPNFNLDKPTARRVKAARLRGESSYGTVMSLKQFCDYMFVNYDKMFMYLPNGMDVSRLLNIYKWEPPVKDTHGDVAKPNPVLHTYTDIENWRNYPDVFTEEDDIVVLSKVHGSCCALGYILGENENGEKALINTACSHNTNRKEYDSNGSMSLYWQPYQWYPQIKALQRELYEHAYTDGEVSYQSEQPVIVFGEIYGQGVQDMTYGLTKKDFRVFDISVGGRYIGWNLLQLLCKKFNVPTVVELYRGPYSREVIEEYTNGPVVECDPSKVIGKFKGREGIVFKTVNEDTHPTIGRKILKSVSVDYLERKNQTDSH